MGPLFSEFARAQSPILGDPRVTVWLARTLRIPASAFVAPPNVGVARVAPADDGTYQPVEDGKVKAIILPAQCPVSYSDFDAYLAELADLGGDLVAFDATNPLRWWTRWGLADALNPEAIVEAGTLQRPLTLFSDPLCWMRAAGASGCLNWRAGAVVLDWRFADRLLGNVPAIVCDALPLAEKVENALSKLRRRPKVLVRREAA
ncbi:MAG TPA: hypothetical protein VK196_06480 [Magnetospirillum sp.]|nr:hypothetical protein [Magnetospirillum sp.]